jgi:hypothetical protein
MSAEFVTNPVPHYENEYVEFGVECDGRRRTFRIDRSVFEDMTHARGMPRARMRELFESNRGRILRGAIRKFADAADDPLVISIDDLRR